MPRPSPTMRLASGGWALLLAALGSGALAADPPEGFAPAPAPDKAEVVVDAHGGWRPADSVVPIMRLADPQLKPYAPAGMPAPSAEPRNLEGVWLPTFFVISPFTTVTGESAPYTGEAQNIVWHRLNMSHVGQPVAEPGVLCRPPGLTRDTNEDTPFQIVQGKDKIVFLTEEGHSVRIVWMDAEHPKDLKPSYMGHSVGRWEGDTLVVDTVGFNDLTWIDYAGSPHSDRLRVTERFRRVDLGGPYPDLQAMITIEDPVYYTRPWTYLKTFRWRPDEMVSEYNCEENMRPEALEGVQIENPRLVGR